MADKQRTNDGLRELALFAGAGGGILGGKLLGWNTVCAVEWEQYPASVLAQRQNDGLLPPFPIWDDVQTFDGKPWRGLVDVVSGGFPCQDISCAGKGAGITGERSGMWGEMARIIGEIRPRYAFIENSPMLTIRGLESVLCDLAAMGYNAEWGVLGASDVGAPHKRDRIWILGYASSNRQSNESVNDETPKLPEMDVTNTNGELYGQQYSNAETWGHSKISSAELADTTSQRQPRQGKYERPVNTKTPVDWKADRFIHSGERVKGQWQSEPDVGRVVNGLAAKMDRLKAIGNGQVPQCAAEAFRRLLALSEE